MTWDLIHVHKIWWPSDFWVSLGGVKVMLQDIDLFPSPVAKQLPLIDAHRLDNIKRTEYPSKRTPP